MAVAVGVRPALDVHAAGDRVAHAVGLAGVVEAHARARRAPPDDVVGDPDRPALPEAGAEVGLDRAADPDRADDRRGVGRDRQPVDALVGREREGRAAGDGGRRGRRGKRGEHARCSIGRRGRGRVRSRRARGQRERDQPARRRRAGSAPRRCRRAARRPGARSRARARSRSVARALPGAEEAVEDVRQRPRPGTPGPWSRTVSVAAAQRHVDRRRPAARTCAALSSRLLTARAEPVGDALDRRPASSAAANSTPRRVPPRPLDRLGDERVEPHVLGRPRAGCVAAGELDQVGDERARAPRSGRRTSARSAPPLAPAAGPRARAAARRSCAAR